MQIVRVAFLVAAALPAAQAAAQDGGRSMLDKLRAAPAPEQQRDLDTMTLASAHRERAESIEQRTSGLWQSWLVSVCEGCGPERRSYSDRDAQELMRRAADDSAKRQGEKKYLYSPPSRPARASASGSIYSDLSTNNIEQIRRDPNR